MARLGETRGRPAAAGMGTRTVGGMGCDLHPARPQRPPPDDRDVPAAVGGADGSRKTRTDHAGTHGTNRRNETMYPKITLIILTIAAAGCSPLRSTRSERHETLAITDSTLTMLFRQEFERQIGTLYRTVVEFYPPAEYPEPSDDRLPNPTDTLRAVFPPPKIPAASASRQPVKRISYTEVSMQNDRTILTDSISHSRINTVARNDM